MRKLGKIMWTITKIWIMVQIIIGWIVSVEYIYEDMEDDFDFCGKSFKDYLDYVSNKTAEKLIDLFHRS